MPRKATAKTITLLLPSPSAALPNAPTKSDDPSTPGPSTQTSTTTSDAATLEVLLLAQKLAREKGHAFDIESFLTPAQRAEYYTTILRRPAPTSFRTGPHDNGGPSTPDQLVKRPAEDGESLPATPIATDSPATEEGTPGTAKKRKLPDLSHLHWKQRAKKIAEMARLEAEGLDPMEALAPADRDPLLALPAKMKGEVNRAEVQAKASHWNSLLIEARRLRGPQWEYHAQSYHVDRYSDLYYNHGQDPPASPKEEDVKEEKEEPASAPTMPPSDQLLGNPRRDSQSAAPLPNVPQRPPIQQPGMSYVPSPASHAGSLPSQPSYTPQPSPQQHQTQSMPHNMPSLPQYPQQHQQHQQIHQPHHQHQQHQQRPPHQQQIPPQQQQQPQTARMPPQGQMNGMGGMSGGGGMNGMNSFQFNPQQLAQFQQMSANGQPGGLNPAMLQMAAAARNGQPLPAGINPASLANFANMQNFRPPPNFQMNQQGMNMSALGMMQGGPQGRQSFSPMPGQGQGQGQGQQGQGAPMMGQGGQWQQG